mmetsp:Transcript_37506/g.43659  ORF Transcript_37506/g.43659 Transcript_37506/m.43659 type:complete len:234 (-) Transcript_37506:313-1014(-)|eukprot:CAMPEP_0171310834 /NCGR_PEP_ID=MMETSP0816-20121228/21028_1 /TAXON_ID=420281 /ORGANISM="Proboscia inermis, Strain CCAP1064/1" /LENGTH=233 /DNA_ID=CAMNT_0011795187 /DNA_START=31 /DNA_END=732 /DNA_ORIENTATION=+
MAWGRSASGSGDGVNTINLALFSQKSSAIANITPRNFKIHDDELLALRLTPLSNDGKLARRKLIHHIIHDDSQWRELRSHMRSLDYVTNMAISQVLNRSLLKGLEPKESVMCDGVGALGIGSCCCKYDRKDPAPRFRGLAATLSMREVNSGGNSSANSVSSGVSSSSATTVPIFAAFRSMRDINSGDSTSSNTVTYSSGRSRNGRRDLLTRTRPGRTLEFHDETSSITSYKTT